jgi:hypothetical protein
MNKLHNPYLATPLSITSYRMATSPSDKNNHNVVAWLDRLQSSVARKRTDTVRGVGGVGGPAAFTMPRATATGAGDGEDSDGEENARLGIDSRNPFGLGGGEDEGLGALNRAACGGEAGGDDADAGPDPEGLQTLPDASVPLGLIANLSLSNTMAKNKSGGVGRRGHGGGAGRVEGEVASDADADDDNVVRLVIFPPLVSLAWLGVK